MSASRGQEQVNEPGAAPEDTGESRGNNTIPNPVDPAGYKNLAGAGDSALKINDNFQDYAGSTEPNSSGTQDHRLESEAEADHRKTAAKHALQDPEDKGDGAEDLNLQTDSKGSEEFQHNVASGDSSSEINTIPNPVDPADYKNLAGAGDSALKINDNFQDYAGSTEPNSSGTQDHRLESEAEADHRKTAAKHALQDPEDKGDGAAERRDQENVNDKPPTKDSGSTSLPSGFSANFILFSAIAVAVLAIMCICLGSQSYPDPVPSRGRVDIFHEEIGRVKLNFPSQRAVLWKRSEIHLTRHLEAKRPTEPASLILTSGRGAKKTLGCLAIHIANALSTALNTSVLEIDGTGKALLDSDQVKLDIDEKLKMAFGVNKGPAVIHRFEEFPPGSTLIFYRYCDHENAAFKEASLIFTVLLEEFEQLELQMSLSDVEEMVQDHIKGKFLSSSEPATFDKMDVDKLGGLWSRISHLVLPVAPEKDIELEGCRSLE